MDDLDEEDKEIKNLLAGIMTVAMILTSVIVVPQDAKAADGNGIDQSGTYAIADYWTETTKTAPVKDGYVFAGWYAKEGDDFVAIDESELNNEVVASMTAYPKFVPDEVLSVKTQMGTKGNKTSLRLLSSVDSTEYQYVGFIYQLGSGNVGNKKMDKVYSGIKLSQDSEEVVKPSEEFSTESQYFVAVNITNIASKNFETVIYARPYWITMDGTKVMGLARNNRVEDKVNDYVSVPVNLLTDGKAPAGIAAGQIEITYNTANYDVVVVDDKEVDFGKVFAEMEVGVNEEKGTINIVGNAATVNENVAADGIFANIRFVKSDNATSDALDFAVKTTSFCDWDEKMIDANIFVR